MAVRVRRYASRVAHQRRRVVGWALLARAGDARCVHNVHESAESVHYPPKKHPSVRRCRIKVYLCQLVTGSPLTGLIHTSGVARKANYGITRNCLTIEEMHIYENTFRG